MDISRRERRALRRAERDAHREVQQEAQRRRSRNKRIVNYAIALLIVAATGYGVFRIITAAGGPGQYDDLAKCLTAKGAVMYGTQWCPHCKAQKEAFGSSFRYVTYVDCDANPQACAAAGVKGYPTWTFPTGERLEGEQKLETLAATAQCKI